MDEYVYFDRHTDAQSSLIEFCACIEQIPQNYLMWKYAIISIHNALQAYLCITLSAGNSFQTWNEKHLKKWLEAYRSNQQLPDTKLDYFMELFDKTFSTDEGIDRGNIKWLNDTRNNLIHFNSDSFSIHIESAFICCKEAINAVVAVPSKAVGIFYYEQEQKEQFEALTQKAGSLLSGIENKLNKSLPADPPTSGAGGQPPARHRPLSGGSAGARSLGKTKWQSHIIEFIHI